MLSGFRQKKPAGSLDEEDLLKRSYFAVSTAISTFAVAASGPVCTPKRRASRGPPPSLRRWPRATRPSSPEMRPRSQDSWLVTSSKKRRVRQGARSNRVAERLLRPRSRSSSPPDSSSGACSSAARFKAAITETWLCSSERCTRKARWKAFRIPTRHPLPIVSPRCGCTIRRDGESRFAQKDRPTNNAPQSSPH